VHILEAHSRIECVHAVHHHGVDELGLDEVDAKVGSVLQESHTLLSERDLLLFGRSRRNRVQSKHFTLMQSQKELDLRFENTEASYKSHTPVLDTRSMIVFVVTIPSIGLHIGE
jgi:hypothetical protein